MASPLIGSSVNAAGVAFVKGFASQAGTAAEPAASGPANLLDIFAALLNGCTAARDTTPVATQSSEAGLDLKLANLVDLSLDFGQSDDQGQNPDAVAAMFNAIVPIQVPAEPVAVIAEFSALIDGLADIKASIDTGKPLDPELLQRVDANLDNLAAALDLDLDKLPNLADLAALLTAPIAIDGEATPVGAEGSVTTTLAPVAQALLNGEATASAAASSELPGLVKSIGGKLANLLQSITGDEVDLAAIGLEATADSTIDPQVEAAFARFAASAKTEAAVPAVILATPQLKLEEPAITGKAKREKLAKDDAVVAIKANTPAVANAEVKTLESDIAPVPVSTAAPGEANATDAAIGIDTADSKLDRKADGAGDAKPETRQIAAAVTADQPLDPQASTLTPHQASRIDAAAAPRAMQAGYQTSQQQLNLPQLAFEVVRQASDGNTRFNIRLDPAELGRIDVKLDIDATGQVNARLTVEKPETLDMMQRDQRGLERALQQAGLDTSKTNLEFSLKQNPFGSGQQGQGGNGQHRASNGPHGGPEADDLPAPTINLYRGSLSASGVNIIA